MNVTYYDKLVSVACSDRDEKYRTESAFWYALKKELISGGKDVIKKLMCKDGHLVSESIYYIRARDWSFAIYDQDYQIRSLSEKFNQRGSVVLTLREWKEST